MGPLGATASTLGAVAVVSLLSLVGAPALLLRPSRVARLTSPLIAFAVGGLLGDAFIHLLPELFSEGQPPLRPSLLVLGGMLLFFVVEKALRRNQAGHRLAAINLLGDGVHNFIDGMLIASSFLAGPRLGVATTIAVVLHELPQELGDFAVLLHSGLAPRKALLLNFVSACTAFLGAIVALVAGAYVGDAVVPALLPIAAGGFVYIAAADLIPELQNDKSFKGLLAQIALIVAGIAVMGALKLAGQ